MNEYINQEDATMYTVVFVVQTAEPGENHRPVTSHWYYIT
jgi:hypothetical protein